LRLVVPPLVVLLVALALRDNAPEPTPPTPSGGGTMEPVLAPAPAARILLFAEDATARAAALRARLDPGIDIVPVPKSDRERLKQYGIDQLPAVVIEQPEGTRSIRTGDDAALAAVIDQCRKLGLPLAEAER